MRVTAIDICTRSASSIPDVNSLIPRTGSDKVFTIFTRNWRPGESKYFVAVALVDSFNGHIDSSLPQAVRNKTEWVPQAASAAWLRQAQPLLYTACPASSIVVAALASAMLH